MPDLAALPPALSLAILRCADALEDDARLKAELPGLQAVDDERARFAAAVFELELARRGDAEARERMLEVADSLLAFWRSGSGTRHSHLHPALEGLWLQASALLVGFEVKRFQRALGACWEARGDATRLAEALEALQPAGNRRVEFARCLYHLELARLGDPASRAAFAQRAGLLTEAYQHEAVAEELVGTDEGLAHLWRDLKPYLDEFFEQLEEQSTRAMESTRRIDIKVLQPAHLKTEPALPAVPASAVPPPPPPPAAPLAEPPPPEPPVERPVPSFRSLVDHDPELVTPPITAPQHVRAEQVAPPPPPTDLTPPGAWFPEPDIDVVEADAAPEPPPPPPAPALDGAVDVDVDVTAAATEEELIDIDEVEATPPPPPPPVVTPSNGVPPVPLDEDFIDVEEEEEPPSPAVLDFWDYTFASLQLSPQDGRRTRMLASESRADRKRLTTWLDGLPRHYGVPEAQAFACQVRLMLAADTREKSLFGQANPRRSDAVEAALSLLTPAPEAAGRTAVWFELDGPESTASLQRGLELLTEYLTFCAREVLDPLDPQAMKRFAAL